MYQSVISIEIRNRLRNCLKEYVVTGSKMSRLYIVETSMSLNITTPPQETHITICTYSANRHDET